MTLKDQLLALATGYATHQGISLVRLSSRVFDDGKKLNSLAERGDITTARFERGMKWFSENWPDGAEWPLSVPRPDVALSGSTPPGARTAEARA